MFLANFVKKDMVKLKKNRELGVLTPGIKRDGYQKNPGNKEGRLYSFPNFKPNPLDKLWKNINHCLYKSCLFKSPHFNHSLDKGGKSLNWEGL